MKPLPRLLVCATFVVGSVSACNAILGIGDLVDPGAPDGSAEAAPGSDSSSPDSSVPDSSVTDSSVGDSIAPDGSLCGSPGETDPCLMIVPQADGGSVFPTWTVTSDLPIHDTGPAIIQPVTPNYVDAGAGMVIETVSQLTWQTTHGAGGAAVDFATAVAACQALGPAWRVPTRIEAATIQYRSAVSTATTGPTSCVPTKFELNEAARLWTSTQVPGAAHVGVNYQATEVPGCSFFGGATTGTANVRCVKGDTKPATFLVSKKKDSVLAVDTQLEWERTGLIVNGYLSAKAHCDSLGWRVPVIQEVYGIIDTRTTDLFVPGMFVQPSGAAPRAVVSQTVTYAGGAGPYYWAPALNDGPFGTEDATIDVDTMTNLLIRCVRRH
jgi:hypothetical protein